MKKILFFAILSCGMFLASCSKSCDAADVTAATKKITDAGIKYTTDQSKANCDAYKAALDAFVKDFADCESVTAATLDSFKASSTALTCK
jgi:uncharacterized protein YaaR (DUF327 family)